jgi:hypothetical protein
MDDEATNYNPLATVDDGSCTYPPTETPPTVTPEPTEKPHLHYGCMDKAASNYAPGAERDNGTCVYTTPTPVSPDTGVGDGLSRANMPWKYPVAGLSFGLAVLFAALGFKPK